MISLFKKKRKKVILNLFKKKHKKNVLFSYSAYHFAKKINYSHSNFQESHIIATIFDELGFNVDVINNNELTTLKLSKYDLIFGEGLPLYQATTTTNIPTIYYGTGSYPRHCTYNSIIRQKEFKEKYGITFLKGARVLSQEWSIAAILSNQVICIGNKDTKKTFIENGCKSVYKINPTFYPRSDAKEIFNNRKITEARVNLLWFGSYGFIHKGLDLAIEAIKSKPNWTLHICGKETDELDIFKIMKLPKNAIYHGFIDVTGEKFKDIQEKCLFTILPSASEGISTSIITCMGNGGLIPIISKSCGVDYCPIEISLTKESIVNQLNHIETLTEQDLQIMSKNSFQFANKNFLATDFKINLKHTIEKITAQYLK